MFRLKTWGCVFALICTVTAFAGEILVDPAEALIVRKTGDSETIQFAAQELQEHLKLITGITIPVRDKAEKGKYIFYVGIRPASDREAKFNAHEARHSIDANAAYFYGDDSESKKMKSYGSAYAVYDFLEELGVRWIAPGDGGRSYPQMKVLAFDTSKGAYTPRLLRRHIRMCYKPGAVEQQRPFQQFTPEEYRRRSDEELLWRRRARLGSSIQNISYGHAFTKYWEMYGKSNPEFFALNKNGKRAPKSAKNADRVKMCVTNQGLIKEIVKNYQKNGAQKYLCVSENDSRDFCCCEKCQALDVVLPGEEELDVDERILSDRYLHFTNAVHREARKIRPDVVTLFYAYSRYNFPPRREKLDDGIYIFFVPNLSMPYDVTHDYYQKWQQANAKDAFIRPNDFTQDTGLPMGFEQYIFDKFQIAGKYMNILGTDYDACFGFWPTSGIATYIASRMFYRPEKSFGYWEDEYCAAFGDAKEEVKAYFRYWRENMWLGRLVNGDYGKYSGLIRGRVLMRTQEMWLVDLLYDEEDFDKTDAILELAAKKELSAVERSLVEKLQLSNRHARLKFLAMNANRPASDATEEEKRSAAGNLAAFRAEYRDELNIDWEKLAYIENTFDDMCGMLRLQGTEEPKRRELRIADDAMMREVREKQK